MNLTKEQYGLAGKIADVSMYIIGIALLVASFEARIKHFLGILGIWLILAAYYSSGKEKAIAQLKTKHKIKEE